MRKYFYQLAIVFCAFGVAFTAKAQLNLAWEELGPNNLGSHVRAIAVGTNAVWAGSVGGGFWKSTNGGTTWNQVTGVAGNLAVSSVAAEGNNIYVGTGETYFYRPAGAFINPPFSHNTITTWTAGFHQYAGMPGEGVFVSNDGGATWNHNNGTWNGSSVPYDDDFMSIQKVVVKNGRVLIATLSGLYYSDDAALGTVTLSTGTTNFTTKPITDVEFGSGSTVWASTGDSVYKSTDGGASFGAGLNGSIPFQSSPTPFNFLGGDRIGIAVAPSNPDIVYVTGARPYDINGNCTGVFKTADNGATWSRVAPYESGTFTPFKNKGFYNMVLEVDPHEANSFYIGGAVLYKYSDADGLIEACEHTYIPGFYDNYVPAPVHTMVFDPANPDVHYIGTDNEIVKSTDAGETYNFRTKGFNNAHMFSVTANADWSVAGTERYTGVVFKYNGSSDIDFQEFNTVYDDYSGMVRYSNVDYTFMIASASDGGVERSLSNGLTWETFYGFPMGDSSHPALGTDSLWIDRATDSTAGGNLYDDGVQPLNPFVLDEVFTPADLSHDSSITAVASYLYMASRHFVWVCTNPFGTLDSLPAWNRLTFNLVSASSTTREFITAMAVSGDASHTLYVGTNYGKIFRITGAHDPWNVDPATDVVRVDVNTAGMPARWISGFAFDPADRNNMVITYGAYENSPSSFVYITNNALAASAASVTFREIGSTLPELGPAYCAAFHPSTHGLLVGTETGLYGTTGDWTTASPLTWNNESNGFGEVPVYDIYIRPYYKADIGGGHYRYGEQHSIFVATHGRGIFKSNSYVGTENPVVQNGFDMVLFPNPVRGASTVQYTLDAAAEVTIEVFSIEGRKVAQLASGQYPAGTFTAEFNGAGLNAGLYFVNAKVNNSQGSSTKTVKAVVIR